MAGQRKPAQNGDSLTGLSTPAKVEVVAGIVRGLRTRLFQLEVVQEANDHSDDDIYSEQGRPYGEVKKQLRESQERIERKHKKLMPQVNKALGVEE